MSGGTLYVVATPVGNLRDITLRALDVLRGADIVAAEDTRHSRILLQHYGIAAQLFALHEHNEQAASERLVGWLREGKSVALISDAGTPAICDPGALLVRKVTDAGFTVVPVPGPSALAAALSVSGIAQAGFRFEGFLPSRHGERSALLEKLAASGEALVFYEAPHRIVEAMRDVAQCYGAARGVVLCRELTKHFESVHRCLSGEAPQWLEADANRQRGEFVVIVEGAKIETLPEEEIAQVLTMLLPELPLKQAVALATKLTGAKRNAVYALALKMQEQSG